MRIALMSFEYAGTVNNGGIGTYTRNAARMLADAGHNVEVFTAGANAMSTETDGLVVNQVDCDRAAFPGRICEAFAQRHEASPFDVVESPEYGCDGREVARLNPALPLVVKLHGPSFSIHHSNVHYTSRRTRLRFAAGALSRLRWPSDPWRYDAATDAERSFALNADAIAANSRSTADYASAEWNIARDRFNVVPYAFRVPNTLANLAPAPSSRTILYFGRLEARKGVTELAKAIRLMHRQAPDVRFRLVGSVLPHPDDGRPMSEHVLELAGAGATRIEITGGLPYAEIPRELAEALVCVFPSDWEASGFVCLEAMAAARAVVASASGGMAESIVDGETGVLVPHRDPRAIADALLALLADPAKCGALGLAARRSVSERFHPRVILPLQEASYARAIERAQVRTAR